MPQVPAAVTLLLLALNRAAAAPAAPVAAPAAPAQLAAPAAQAPAPPNPVACTDAPAAPGKTLRTGAGKSEMNGLASHGDQLLLRCRAHDLSAMGIGDDESSILGKYVRGNIRQCGKEQGVAIVAIVRPFIVCFQIGDR